MHKPSPKKRCSGHPHIMQTVHNADRWWMVSSSEAAWRSTPAAQAVLSDGVSQHSKWLPAPGISKVQMPGCTAFTQHRPAMSRTAEERSGPQCSDKRYLVLLVLIPTSWPKEQGPTALGHLFSSLHLGSSQGATQQGSVTEHP